MNKTPSWPAVPGSYIVGDPLGPVAVCTLTSEKLMGQLASLAGVAISGMVYTANLGITRIIVNITSNPAIRFLLVCGRDSPLFGPGQSIVALADNGIDNDRRIVGANGYEPVLKSANPDQVARFRRQVEVVDWTGEEDLEALKNRISELSARNPGRFKIESELIASPAVEPFVEIRPGGQREPLIYDPKGYFVISVEHDNGEILLRHYLPDHTLAHEMRGRGATSMLLGLIRDGLVTQLSHAGYLGEELAKAQTAVQFGLRYDQDRPLRSRAPPVQESPKEGKDASTGDGEVAQKKPSPPVQPMTLKQFNDSAEGSDVDLVLEATKSPRRYVLSGPFLEMDEAQPFIVYHRTEHQISFEWSKASRIIMGVESEIRPGALLRIGGKLGKSGHVEAEHVIILTRVAKIAAQ